METTGYLLLRWLFYIAHTVILSSTAVSPSLLLSTSRFRHKIEDANGNRGKVRMLGGEDASRGLERCLQDKFFAERVELGTQCICKDRTGDDVSDDDKGIVMICSDECAFCNADRTVCGLKSEEALYDVVSGSKIGVGQVFKYLKFGPIMNSLSELDMQSGDDIIIGIEELHCNEQDVDDKYEMDRCSTCNVYFGDEKCNFCEVIECGDSGSGIFAPVMDCTNIQENAIYDFCLDVSMESDSLFQAFRPNQFNKCLPMQNLLDE